MYFHETHCRPIRLALVTLAATVGFLNPVEAATSSWADSEGGRMRLVALPADEEGHVRAVLQVEPNPGWITYWKEPGESGIPPQVSLSPGSKGAIDRIAYPAPKPITIGNIREIGYDAPVSFPIDFHFADNAKDGTLAVTSFIGLCKDVCIPFQGELSVALQSGVKPTSSELAQIAAADAMLPESSSSDFAVNVHKLAADGKTVSLQLTLPSDAGEYPQIYLTGPSGYAFFRQTNARRDGHRFDADIAIGKLPNNYAMHGKVWGILVVDGERAMETTLAFD